MTKSNLFSKLKSLKSLVYIIYINDSSRDLESLITIDVEIIIRDEKNELEDEQLELKRTLRRFVITTT